MQRKGLHVKVEKRQMKKFQVIPELIEYANNCYRLSLKLSIDDFVIRTTEIEYNCNAGLSCGSTNVTQDLQNFLTAYSHDQCIEGVNDDRDGILKLIEFDLIDKWKIIDSTISSERLQQSIIQFLIDRELYVSKFV